MTATTTLKRAQAEGLLAAERRVERAASTLELAKKDRETLRERYKPKLPMGLEVLVAGIRVKFSRQPTGASFSLKDYLAAGHEITPEMRPFYKRPGERDAWLVKPGDELKAVGRR